MLGQKGLRSLLIARTVRQPLMMSDVCLRGKSLQQRDANCNKSKVKVRSANVLGRCQIGPNWGNVTTILKVFHDVDDKTRERVQFGQSLLPLLREFVHAVVAKFDSGGDHLLQVCVKDCVRLRSGDHISSRKAQGDDLCHLAVLVKVGASIL